MSASTWGIRGLTFTEIVEALDMSCDLVPGTLPTSIFAMIAPFLLQYGMSVVVWGAVSHLLMTILLMSTAHQNASSFTHLNQLRWVLHMSPYFLIYNW